MKTRQKKILYFYLIVDLFLFVACSKPFTIDGMWESSGGKIYSFNNGSVSASLFGFQGGPDGSYTLSEKANEDGYYELYGSHITGGEVNYLVDVSDNDSITLTLTSESAFAPESLSLNRK